MKDKDISMSEEIKFRLESDSWDRMIAARVLAARNKKNFWITRLALASLATAACLLVVSMAAFYNIPTRYSTDDLVYAYVYTQNHYAADISTMAVDVELIISETYPMR